jgi:type I restriction enzyme S subunit
MSEWREITLGEVGTVSTGKTPSKNNPEEWGNEILFITPTDYRAYNKWARDSIRKLSFTGEQKFLKKILPPNSVLVTCIGSDMGKVVMNVFPSVTNQQINSIVPNEKEIDNHFLYYYLWD